MRWVFGLILFWLLFVTSLASWWFYFGVTRLAQMNPGLQSGGSNLRRMLFMEGCVLLVFLFGGGLALFYFSYRMYTEKSAKEIFFASFAHDLKTALFRLQLEAEKQAESPSPKVGKILGHTRKMQLDLENNLDWVVGGQKKIFLEKISLQDFLTELHTQWPEFGIQWGGEDQIQVDKKALYSIFKNLLHNSFVHGQADEVRVNLRKKDHKYLLSYEDNGKEFCGDVSTLGQVCHRGAGGSGFGLFIVCQWVKRLGGRVHFSKNKISALQVAIELPQRRGS